MTDDATTKTFDEQVDELLGPPPGDDDDPVRPEEMAYRRACVEHILRQRPDQADRLRDYVGEAEDGEGYTYFARMTAGGPDAALSDFDEWVAINDEMEAAVDLRLYDHAQTLCDDCAKRVFRGRTDWPPASLVELPANCDSCGAPNMQAAERDRGMSDEN